MVGTLIDAVDWFGTAIAVNFLRVVLFPISPAQRLFVVYVATSLIIAIAMYWWARWQQPVTQQTDTSLREFLFPSSVWRTASARLDVRFFFFHQILRVSLYGGFVVAVADWTVARIEPYLAPVFQANAVAWWAEGVLVLASVALVDFVAFGIHYCQHHVPLLWQFHKVHHSPRVMHPLTTYREHPFDNVLNALGVGVTLGLFTAISTSVLGYEPVEPMILGVGVSLFVYNNIGFHWRHSHLWIRWPGILACVVGSPAHHQVHHSYHPAHINRNFAFMFPVWDLVFGTFHVPPTNADVKFGLGEEREAEYQSCLDLYVRPVRELLFGPRESRTPEQSVDPR